MFLEKSPPEKRKKRQPLDTHTPAGPRQISRPATHFPRDTQWPPTITAAAAKTPSQPPAGLSGCPVAPLPFLKEPSWAAPHQPFPRIQMKSQHSQEEVSPHESSI